MTRRRAVLRITASAVLVGLAGCTDGDDESADVDHTAATQHLDAALATLATNHETIVDWANGQERDQETIDSRRDDLDSARTSLDDAEDVAPEDIATQIDQARAVATFQESVLDFYELAIEYGDHRADAEALMDAEDNDGAIQQLEAARDSLENLRTQFDEMAAAHDDIEPDALEENDLDYEGSVTEYVDIEAKGEVDAHEPLVEGFIHFNQAFLELEAGFATLEAGRPAEARSLFRDGQTEYDDARAAFETVRTHDHTPRDIRQQALFMLGALDDTDEAVDLFIQATREIEAGNQDEAESLVTKAWAKFEDL